MLNLINNVYQINNLVFVVYANDEAQTKNDP